MQQKQDFSNIEQAAQALANQLGDTLRDAIALRDTASLAVSGGSTPKHVFQYLIKQDVDWSKVILTLTDERWVSANHSESNEKLVYDFLLTGALQATQFVSFYGGEASPKEGQAACEARLSAIAQPFDAVYLGMGEDGHFASLFPNDSAINVDNGLCIAIPETETRLPRMSLTPKAILHARKIFFLFSGEEKHSIYEKAQQAGSIKALPVRLLLSQKELPLSVLTAP